MNLKGLFAACLVCGSLVVQGGVWYSSGSIDLNQSVPDGNLTGLSSTYDASGWGNSIQDVKVTLNFSGGYNGDLYAYISHAGVLVPLLNRVGVGEGLSSNPSYSFGYSTAGMHVLLQDGYTDIHTVASPQSPDFAYSPDGRTIDPRSSAGTFAAFDTANRVGFSAFGNKDANGAWTLFVADVAGGGQSQLVNWSLDVEAVPEPVNMALILSAGLFGLTVTWKHLRKGINP